MDKYREIQTLDELQTLLDNTGQLYIRYSANIHGDVERGFSTNHATHQSEGGLSVNPLLCTYGAWSPDVYLPMQVADYSFMRMGVGLQAWILSGDECGRGGDNEPLLTNARVVAKLSNEAVEEACDWARERRKEADKRLGWTYV